MSDGKEYWRERLRRFLRKPYVIIPVVFVALLYAGFVTVALFVALGSIYVLGTLLGFQTLQLVASSISAIAAAGSATAAILIWRGNVRSRKTVLIDRVLGPTYAELRHSREIIQSWKSEAREVSLSTPFLDKVSSDWMYYTLREELRSELEQFQKFPPDLDQKKALAKTAATDILREATAEAFNVEKKTGILLWTSHTWSEHKATGESGRSPILELVADSDPLKAPEGYYVHTLQVVNTDNATLKSLALLSEDKLPLNRELFQKFWDIARKKALADPSIIAFREARDLAHALATRLEKKLDSEIKRSQ